MPGLTDRFASVEQQKQFLWCPSLTGKGMTDSHPEEWTSAHIEEVINGDLNPLDDSGPDEPPQDKGKGRTEDEHPNNYPPNGGDDRDDGNDPDGSDTDSNGSDACCNKAITCSIGKWLSSLFSNIDDDEETAWTSNPDTFDGSNLKALNSFFTDCARTSISRPKAYKKHCSHVTYALSYLHGSAQDHLAQLISEADNTGIVPPMFENWPSSKRNSLRILDLLIQLLTLNVPSTNSLSHRKWQGYQILCWI